MAALSGRPQEEASFKDRLEQTKCSSVFQVRFVLMLLCYFPLNVYKNTVVHLLSFLILLVILFIKTYFKSILFSIYASFSIFSIWQ